MIKILVSLILCFFCFKVSSQSKIVITHTIVKNDYIGGIKMLDDTIPDYQKYNHLVKDYTFKVNTKNELIDALLKSHYGDVIFISNNINIDLTDTNIITIPAGITLAGDRGKYKRKGAQLFTKNQSAHMFIMKRGSRITGLRIKGPDSLIHHSAYELPTSDGITANEGYIEIDNCEISDWSHAGIFLLKGLDSGYIHHNYIHHCERAGLGYGVCLDQCHALVEANIFDYDRHAIAATGRPGTGYEARYNLVLNHAPISYEQLFDMHGGKDRKDGTNIAGDYVNIHDNTFFVERNKQNPVIVVRGYPLNGGSIYNNHIIFLLNENSVPKQDFNTTQVLVPHFLDYADSTVNKITPKGFIREYFVPSNINVFNNTIIKK